MDRLNLALQAQKTLETNQLQFAFGSGYPLNVFLAAVFVGVAQLFGCHDPVWSVNIMSVLFCSLGVAAFYALLRFIRDETTAWLGAALFCFNPVLWGTSVYGMNHTPSLFFLIMGLNFLFRYLKINARKDFMWGAVFIGFMGATLFARLFAFGSSPSILHIVTLYERAAVLEVGGPDSLGRAYSLFGGIDVSDLKISSQSRRDHYVIPMVWPRYTFEQRDLCQG